ncbi:MAG: DUF1080 domain-containing protein [Terrimonas sp.]|nr:DUF1080 domain-containing protein [Terrimonas sp.]
MKSNLFMLLALFVFMSCNDSGEKKEDNTQDKTVAATPDNTLSEQEKKDGWQLLFDGTTKSGWHVYANKTDGSAWVVDNGTLHLAPQQMKDWQAMGGGDILTQDEYENFDLKLDWKIDSGGNSGIIFYVHESDDTVKYKHAWYTGPEMQVLDNAAHPDAKIIKHRAGDLYDLITSSPETVKPAGEWNHAEIKADHGSLELYLNGTKVVSTTLWDDNWKALIAGSKFKNMPEFGTYKKGRIALQDHGNKVWFKNIKIRPL